MANKQTQPGLAQVQGTYVNTNGNPLIPQTNWKSPLREIAKIGEQGVNLAKQYQDIKFDGYQAQYSIMANQMYHEMQDATDPTQLDEIQAKYEQKFAEPLEDNIWARSYLKSQYRQKWDNTMKENSIKVRYAMQHKFNVIETEKTLNSMAMAAASTGDINAMTSYFDSGIALIDSQEMSVDEKNAAKKAFAANFVTVNFNANPNLANSFAQQYAGELAPYGVDANEIKTKTDSYNVQQENRLYTKKKRAKEEKDEATRNAANTYTFNYLTGKDDLNTYEANMELIAKEAPELAVSMHKTAFPKDRATSQKNKAIEEIATKLEEFNNAPEEEKGALRTEIIGLISSAARRNYASKELQKTWNAELGLSADGKTDYVLAAKTLPEGEFQELIATADDLKGYNVTALTNMNKEAQGFNGRVNYIIDKQGVVSNDEIDSWRDTYGFTEKQIAELKDKAQTVRKSSGRGSTNFERLVEGLSDIDKMPKNARQLYNELSLDEKTKFQQRVKDLKALAQEEMMEELNYQAEEGKLTLPSARKLYYDGKITKEQFKDLLDTINRKATDTLDTQKAAILSKVVNHEYGSLQELLEDLSTLKYDESNKSQKITDINNFKTLYTNVVSEVKSLISDVVSTADSMYSRKSPILGTMDTVTPIRLAQFKEALTREIMEDWANKKSFSELNTKYSTQYLEEQWELYRPSNEEVMRNSLARLYSSDEGDVDTGITSEDSTPSKDKDSNSKSTPITDMKNLIIEHVSSWFKPAEKKKEEPKEDKTKAKKAFNDFVKEKTSSYKVEKNGDITFGDK